MKRSHPVPAGVLESAILGFVIFTGAFSPLLMGLLARFTFGQFFNLCEGLLWLGIAAVIAVRTARSAGPKGLGFGGAVSFALFGVSDFIEMRTGAWYAPWPLLALKAMCVVALLAHLTLYLRRKGGAQGASVAPAVDKLNQSD